MLGDLGLRVISFPIHFFEAVPLSLLNTCIF